MHELGGHGCRSDDVPQASPSVYPSIVSHANPQSPDPIPYLPTQAKLLLDRISDSKTFRQNLQEQLMDEAGGQGGDSTSDPAPFSSPRASFMYLEDSQRRQLEAVALVYDLLKERNLLRAFASLQDTRAYAGSYVSCPVTLARQAVVISMRRRRL